jgi:uncharacterized protein (TIGR02646 family)
MIHVDRQRAIGGTPIQPGPEWFQKAQQLTQDAITEGSQHKVTDYYKDDEVKVALEELFCDKCAYCESPLGAEAPWDVEHYRPKGRVAECDAHPGYYWLAYTWENLFPSCVYCNQRKTDAPRHDDPRRLPAQGKADHFPVEDGHWAMGPGDDLSQEHPLLLNPCADGPNEDPEAHLRYDIQGGVYPIQPNDLRATQSIKYYNLSRRRLRDARAKRLAKVRLVMQASGILNIQDTGERAAKIQIVLAILAASDCDYAGFFRDVQRDPDRFGF